MITTDRLRSIAVWSHDLTENEHEHARRGIVEKAFPKGAYICHRGDRLDSWIGVVSGLIKLSTLSVSGKAVTLAGVRSSGWFGEGTVLKNEIRQYDLVALRDTRIALMNWATFLWLFENSVAFNRFLVRQFNERLGQFIALVEYDRMLDAPARVARNIAWLFNPTLTPISRRIWRSPRRRSVCCRGCRVRSRTKVSNCWKRRGCLPARARRINGARYWPVAAFRRIAISPALPAEWLRPIDACCGTEKRK